MRIVIHRLDVSPYTNDLDGARAFFRDRYGWRDVYHFLVGADVTQQWAAIDARGAHAAPFNTGSWGVAVLGDWRERAPSERQWGAAVDVAARLLWIDDSFPWTLCFHNGGSFRRLSGHGELPGITKDCPGRHFNMDQFRVDTSEALGRLRREFSHIPPLARRAIFNWR